MATRIGANLIHRAHVLGLFQGDPAYYYPEGGATGEERDHLIDVILRTAIDRLQR